MQNAFLITIVSFLALIAAYYTYGRFLARRIFQLNPNRRTPAHRFTDGMDYVPTRTPVLFGHHFASIAGLGPILGPAIAVIWGWVPALLWVVFGCIFAGAVHDLGALTVSLRFRGRSIGDVCQELIGPRARLLFLIIVFFLMSLAMGAFVHAIAALFVHFRPEAIIPSVGLMVVAMFVGVAVYKFGARLTPATILGLGAFGALIWWGTVQPLATYEWFADDSTRQAIHEVRPDASEVSERSPYGAAMAAERLTKRVGETTGLTGEELKKAAAATPEMAGLNSAVSKTTLFWILALLAYGFIAAVLPVWLLLQPRDYINSFQLYIALTMLLVGLMVAAVMGAPENTIQAEPVRHVADAPPMYLFLFVTIACGAISGFHSLVSSGTTVRQINRETDALPIGFGGMLTEGALAVLVIMACVAGLGAAAWGSTGPYAAWKSIGGGGLGAQLNAVVRGGANFLSQIGIPKTLGATFLAVTVVAFALTTLDSATRLLRFNVEEIFKSIKLHSLANRYTGSLVAVGGIALFALVPAGKTLWVLFGTSNQLLAGLTLMTVSLFLYKISKPVIYTLVPMIFMLVMTIACMFYNLNDFWTDDGFWEEKKWLPFGLSCVVLVLSFWLLTEAALSFSRGRGGLTEDTDDGEPPARTEDEPELEAATSAARLG